MLLGKSPDIDRLPRIDRDPHHFQAASLPLVRKLDQLGQFFESGHTPRRPEVEERHFSGLAAQGTRCPCQVQQRQIRSQPVADDGWSLPEV